MSRPLHLLWTLGTQWTGCWLTLHEICCHSMGKCKTANKGGISLQKGTSPFPSLQDREDCDMVQGPNRRDCFWGGGAFPPKCFPKMHFRFRITSRSPSERSVSPEHWWDQSPTPEDQRHYCIQVRVMLGNGRGDQPTLPHAWEGGLNTDILQEAWSEDCITKAVVLSPGAAILFFDRHTKNEGIPYCMARDVKFCLGGPFSWARRSVQIEASRKTMQEGHHAILEAVVEKKTKVRGPWWPWGKTRHAKNSSCGLWHWGVDTRISGRLRWGAEMKWWY